MNRSQYLAAIRAIGPELTARFVEGEFRVSVSVPTIRAAYPELTYSAALARNESLAAYELEGPDALATAAHIREAWLRETAPVAAPIKLRGFARADSDNGPSLAVTAATIRLSGGTIVPAKYLSAERVERERITATSDLAALPVETVTEAPMEAARTIDVTPSWEGLLPAFLALIENGTSEGRAIAVAELTRMARLADNAIASRAHTRYVAESDDDDGRAAFKRGQPPIVCPYDAHSGRRANWLEGWAAEAFAVTDGARRLAQRSHNVQDSHFATVRDLLALFPGMIRESK